MSKFIILVVGLWSAKSTDWYTRNFILFWVIRFGCIKGAVLVNMYRKPLHSFSIWIIRYEWSCKDGIHRVPYRRSYAKRHTETLKTGKLRSVVILFLYHLEVQIGLFPLQFPTKIMYVCVFNISNHVCCSPWYSPQNNYMLSCSSLLPNFH
jgi:hypothetical protein